MIRNINQVGNGGSIVISNGQVTINGIVQELGDSKTINITIEGDCDKIECDNCNTINVKGKINSYVNTKNGSINCSDIGGNAETKNGDIECGHVDGDVNNKNGDIECGDIGGKATSKNGIVEKR